MTLDIAALRELVAKATPGPWDHVAVRHMQHEVFTAEDDRTEGGATIAADVALIVAADDRTEGGATINCWHAAVAALIVAAVNALPGLLDEVERYYKLLPLVQIGMVPLDDEAQTRAAEREAIAAWLEFEAERINAQPIPFNEWKRGYAEALGNAAADIRAGRHVKGDK